jgi:hypothetical protein
MGNISMVMPDQESIICRDLAQPQYAPDCTIMNSFVFDFERQNILFHADNLLNNFYSWSFSTYSPDFCKFDNKPFIVTEIVIDKKKYVLIP